MGPLLDGFVDMALGGDAGPGGVLYAIQRDGMLVSVALDGTRTAIGASSSTTSIDAMAFDADTSTMYAASGNFGAGDSSLYTVDLGTGALTSLGTIAGFVVDGMTFDTGGTLYAMDQYGLWGTIDTTLATVTVIATLDYDDGALTFEGLDTDDATGTLYISSNSSTEGDVLRIVDPLTATTTSVGALGDGNQFPWIAIAPGEEPPATPTCFGLDATIVGTEGDDVINGTSGPDVIVGLGGADTIRGLGGDDVICGNDGNDSLLGGNGEDRINGGNGDDYLHGGAGNDLLNGSKGEDSLHGSDGNDTLKGGQDADSLHGDNGNDYLAGNTGDDRMFGGAGVDWFNGGPGADRIHANDGIGGEWIDGGPDSDVCTTDPTDSVSNCP